MFFPPMIGLGTVALVSAVLLVSVRSGSLTRNLAVGIRTKHTLRSAEAWDAGQLSSLPYLRAIVWIAFGCIVALLIAELTGPAEVLGNTVAASGFGLVVAIALLAWRSADRAAKAVIERGEPVSDKARS